jgi:drug/metabolite transporter (DMT)-like permease
MRDDKLRSQLQLHLLVFIAGFTGILGELITISAVDLVWFRMLMAVILMYAYARYMNLIMAVPFKAIVQFFIAGIIIALHWITFFASIKAANISIALAMFSTGAFFASLVEPIIFKRRIIGYELLLGMAVFVGVYIITDAAFHFITGILLGIASALFSTLFAVLNGRYVLVYNPTVLSIYEFVFGVIFITFWILIFDQGFSSGFFDIGLSNYAYLFILASVCTAYAFISAVKVMRHLSPFTVVLSYNLEPIYGITLAILFFPATEKMSFSFYIGAFIIIVTVILNAIFKRRYRLKAKSFSNG